MWDFSERVIVIVIVIVIAAERDLNLVKGAIGRVRFQPQQILRTDTCEAEIETTATPKRREPLETADEGAVKTAAQREIDDDVLHVFLCHPILVRVFLPVDHPQRILTGSQTREDHNTVS